MWQINREIVLRFNEPVDFASVSANTIHIRSLADVPATGAFELRDERTVVFQPSCPTRDDLADAGLQPDGVAYVLRIPGRDTSSNTVRSASGVPLGTQLVRRFTTPASTQISVAFQDTVPGPPSPSVRASGSADEEGTHLAVGDERVYFEREEDGDLVLSVPGFEAPHNLYSEPSTRVGVVVVFDQPVNPSSENVSQGRLRLEFRDPAGAWHALQTRVTLEANCTEAGARVRLEPIGVLPPASAFRAVVRAGFQDLVGESTLRSLDAFAVAPTRAVEFTSLAPSDVLADETNESFDFSGESPLSFEDSDALFDCPVAEWSGGQLSSAFSFDGSGGPTGDFDWVVRAGESMIFDTNTTAVVGGPDGVPTTVATFVGGVVDVRNFVIQTGGEVRVQGPNPMRINATGDVRIAGVLDLSGFAARDVITLNTTHQTESGGTGAAGGGRGGNGNVNTTAQSSRGGRGDGPFGAPNVGGDGGETGVSNAPGQNGKDQRRPGGGGAGRFARDYPASPTPEGLSVVAGAGADGHPLSRGAETNLMPSRGGAPGAGPFTDGTTANDFLGVRAIVQDGELAGLVRGELGELWAGYGGGGGGNASMLYPNPVFTTLGDEKGGGGGGGAGGLHIKALGSIVFSGEGVIRANGAQGGTGEHTFLDHIGGTGGSGSGGHVILESATLVDFTGGGANVADAPIDHVQAGGFPRKTGKLEHVHDCCFFYSNGGSGGAGVIQIHVPDALAEPSDSSAASDVVVPSAALDDLDPLDAVTSPPAYVLVPTFGARSKARSEWISIGGADQKPDGSAGLVRFLFDGIVTEPGPDEGKVLTSGSRVADREPLLAIADLGASSAARILPDGYTVELSGSALLDLRAGTTSGVSNDVYLRTPALLEGCAVRMLLAQTPSNREDFDVAQAVYDEGAPAPGDERLLVTVSTERGPLTDFASTISGPRALHLVPRFFRVVTDGARDALPSTAFVRVRFQAAADNGAGSPAEDTPLVDWTSDVAEFNSLPPGALQFFRYEVEFDLDAAAQGVTADTRPVALEFLKVPFAF